MAQVLPFDDESIGIVLYGLVLAVLVIVVYTVIKTGIVAGVRKLITTGNKIAWGGVLAVLAAVGLVFMIFNRAFAIALPGSAEHIGEVSFTVFLVGLSLIGIVLSVVYLRNKSHIHTAGGFSKRQIQKRRAVHRAKASSASKSSDSSETWMTVLIILLFIVAAYFFLLFLGVRVL